MFLLPTAWYFLFLPNNLTHAHSLRPLAIAPQPPKPSTHVGQAGGDLQAVGVGHRLDQVHVLGGQQQLKWQGVG